MRPITLVDLKVALSCKSEIRSTKSLAQTLRPRALCYDQESLRGLNIDGNRGCRARAVRNNIQCSKFK